MSREEERLWSARERLYHRQAPDNLNLSRARFRARAGETETSNWDGSRARTEKRSLRGGRPWRWLLVFSVAFFVVATVWAVIVFWDGGRLVSSGNIELTVTGPREVGAGEEASWAVTLTNRNHAPIESVFLIVEYPAMSRSFTSGTNTSLTRERISLGTLAASEVKKQTLRAIVFGELNSVQVIRVAVEYRLSGSNAIFDRSAEASFLISSTPLSLKVELPESLGSQQEVVGRLEVGSNSESVLTGISVAVEYPPGFIFRSADPAPVNGSSLWRLGDLAPGGRRTITFRGTLSGQDGDLKAFHLAAGVEASSPSIGGEVLAVIYDSYVQEVEISRPFISLSVLANGQTGSEVIIPLDELVRIDLAWANNLPDEVSAGELVVRLDGQILDRRSVNVNKGFYQSNTDQITWNRQTLPELERLPAGGSGKASFSLTTVDWGSLRSLGAGLSSSDIKLTASFRGRRLAAGGKTETVEQTEELILKTKTVLQLSGQSWQRGGPFANAGPVPPRVGEETSYAISLAVINALNDVTDGQVSATLPPYVRWLGSVSPSSETVTFDEETGRVIWDLGTIEAGTGLASATREVFFRVAFTPSLSQVGATPVILTQPILTGYDQVVRENLSHEGRNLTIDTSDSEARLGDDKVVE